MAKGSTLGKDPVVTWKNYKCLFLNTAGFLNG